jgi:hypothetical protein
MPPLPKCSFAGWPFDIDADQGEFFPVPHADADGVGRFSAPIILYSLANFRGLMSRRCRTTEKVAAGSFVGYSIVHAGPGAGLLRIPTAAGGASQTYTAILKNLTAESHEIEEGLYLVEAEWVILSDLTP